jgi:DNA-binding PadR family transcriptional regulator
MAGPARVTGPFLDVLEVFIQALMSDSGDLHGWAIMKATKRSGPTVYGVLDRLEDMGWIEGTWEQPSPDQATPRKRFYRLTGAGKSGTRAILRERRPEALSPRPERQRWVPSPRQAGAT